MATMSDIEALNVHISALARELGFAATARLVNVDPSDAAAGLVEVKVSDLRKTPPIECGKSVTIFDYQNAGIHTFDDFIQNEAARTLQTPSNARS